MGIYDPKRAAKIVQQWEIELAEKLGMKNVRGMGQYVAKKAGIPASAYTDVKLANRRRSDETLAKIAEAMGHTYGELIAAGMGQDAPLEQVLSGYSKDIIALAQELQRILDKHPKRSAERLRRIFESGLLDSVEGLQALESLVSVIQKQPLQPKTK